MSKVLINGLEGELNLNVSHKAHRQLIQYNYKPVGFSKPDWFKIVISTIRLINKVEDTNTDFRLYSNREI